MNKLSRILAPGAASLLALAPFGCMPGSSVSTDHLTTEFRENPEGIASTAPRFSWKLRSTDDTRGAGITAYRLIVAGSPAALDAERDLLWDTGVVSDKAALARTLVEYAGKPLASRQNAWWKVRVWDEHNQDAGWSDPARFSLGFVDQAEWRGQWIGLDSAPTAPLTAEVRERLRRQQWIRQPGPPARTPRTTAFRTEFDAKPGAVKSAWFAGTIDQIGALSINGTKIADLARWDMISPIDATAALKPGRNAIGISVEQTDGFNPAATGMLVIEYASGEKQEILVDGSWKRTDSAPAGWDVAGFDASKWSAVEVAGGQPWGGNRNTEHFMPPTPYLRSTFTPDGKKSIAKATLYSTALGVYEARLNGTKISGDELTPGWTEFSKRVYHQTYDVTKMLRSGENCLGVVLGDGWYASLMGYTGKRRHYGGAARFKGQLEIEYTDGTRELFATGPTWKGSFGPLLYTDNYLGSSYDSRLEIPGWDRPRFDDAKWKAVNSGIDTPTPREADVTAKVREALKNPGAPLTVNQQTLGDPAFGVVKTLRVEYTANGEAKTHSLREGENLNLPRPGESGPIVIKKAIFGEPPAAAANFVIEPQPGEPVRRFETLASKSVKEPRPGRYVFDLGQNLVGWTRLTVNGKPGQKIVVRHAEMLNPDGTLYTSNLRGATGTDFYTLKGGPQTLEPMFTFHGFQYVEVTGLTEKPSTSMVTGIVTHTDMAPTGTFECSNPLVNQLVHNIVWGQKGNYLEVPTDCPQRDERLGWTGDAQFFINAAAYSFDIASFMSRWLKTLAHDAQFEDGTFAHVAPRVNERGGSTAWGDAAIVCTHSLYRTYGDTRIIADNYEPMRKYMAWLDGRTTDGISKVGGFGDWVNLGDPTSSDLIDTAYRIELCRIMSEMATVLGKTADADKYAANREASIAAFRSRFLAADGSLKESGQTGYALAFTMGLIPDNLQAKSGEHFAKAIERKNWHLATGFIGTPRLLPGLFNAGQNEVAARLLMNEDYPSWLYQVKLGATTMWERWDGWTPEQGFQDVGMNSFNHYAFGAVGEYLYKNLAGISALEPGYRRIQIAPTPIASLTHVNATYDAPTGKIASAWKKEGTKTTYTITIPPHTTAEIRLPAAGPVSITETGAPLPTVGLSVKSASNGVVVLEAASGTYRFSVSN